MGYRAKAELVGRLAANRKVLHLSAVGETCSNTEARVKAAENSVHAELTRASARCVGVDHDQPSIDLLTKRGVFDNLKCADVRTLSPDEIDLPTVDVIVAGDVLEHLSEPGMMLDSALRLAEPTTRLVIAVPNALGLMVFLRYMRGVVVEGEDHVCAFNIYTLANLLKRHGWEPLRAYTCYQKHAESSRGFRVGRAVFRRLPRLGGTLLIIARPN